MACWLIIRDERGAHVLYENLLTGQKHECGTVEVPITDQELVDWIFTEGSPSYGDIIRLSDGTSFHYHPRDMVQMPN